MINSRSEEHHLPLPCSFLPGRRSERGRPSWAGARRTLTPTALSAHMGTRIHPYLLTHTQSHMHTHSHAHTFTSVCLHAVALRHLCTCSQTHACTTRYDCTYTLEVQWTAAVQSPSCGPTLQPHALQQARPCPSPSPQGLFRFTSTER